MNLPADFPDRLSPMLVKELRQGTRTNLFTVSFILLQVFMVLCLMLGAAAGDSGGGITGFFWFFVGLALLGVMPIRGFAALHHETQLNTMDLIQMTRLSAWRITFGKWLALMSQTLLLVAAILPYIVMRYFLGGIDMVGELTTLLYLCLLSMVLTAITVGFSAFPSVMLRVIISGGILFVLMFGATGVVGILFAGGSRSVFAGAFSSGSASDFWWGLLSTLVTTAYIIYFFLDLGASRIAPESANHATRKRLIGLAFVLLCFSIPIFNGNLMGLMGLGTTALGVIWIDAITEKATLVPSILRPFIRRPALRPSLYVLTPGWHTALLFVIFSGALVLLLVALNPDAEEDGRSVIFYLSFQFHCIAGLATLLFPLLIIHLFLYPVTFSRFFFGLYLLVQVCVGIVTLMVTVASKANGTLQDILYYCVPLPPVMMTAWEDYNGISKGYLFGAALTVLILCLVVPLIRARPLFRSMHKACLDIDAEDPSDAESPSSSASSSPNAPSSPAP